jgi:hypothetical protein
MCASSVERKVYIPSEVGILATVVMPKSVGIVENYNPKKEVSDG